MFANSSVASSPSFTYSVYWAYSSVCNRNRASADRKDYMLKIKPQRNIHRYTGICVFQNMFMSKENIVKEKILCRYRHISVKVKPTTMHIFKLSLKLMNQIKRENNVM